MSAQTSPYLSQFIQGKIIARSVLVCINFKKTSMLNEKRVQVQKQYTYNNIYKSYMQSQEFLTSNFTRILSSNVRTYLSIFTLCQI